MSKKLSLLCGLILAWAGTAGALELQVVYGLSGVSELEGAERPSALQKFNVALVREICRRIDAKCVFSRVRFQEMIPGVEDGRYQLGVGNFLRTAEREERVAFSQPIWNSSSRLLARTQAGASSGKAVDREMRFENLRNVRLAVLDGSQQHRYAQKRAEAQGLELLPLISTRQCLDALRRGEADFALVFVLGAFVLLDRNSSPQLDFVGPAMVSDGLGGSIHIALPKNDPALLAAVDGALAGMRRDGSFQRIWRRHFPFNPL